MSMTERGLRFELDLDLDWDLDWDVDVDVDVDVDRDLLGRTSTLHAAVPMLLGSPALGAALHRAHRPL
jgi:hypothetical protein